MMKKRYCYSILFLLHFVFLCHPAIAAKCVRPNGAGGCYDNINDAIDAVNPGGTVKVYPGIYYQYFNANKPGITIQGMGNKRTDVRIDAEDTASLINAANVTIRNLTIQNGFQGIYILPAGSNSKILNVNIFNSTNNGIRINSADDILIKNCRILKCLDNGVENSNGARLTVQNTTISNCDFGGIDSEGDDLTVDGCTIKNTASDSIYVRGSHPTIHNNQLFQSGTNGIYADSDFIKVTGNLVRGTVFDGIHIRGEAPVVKNNTVMHAQDNGFFIACEGTCSDSKVLNNTSSYNTGRGFRIIVDSSGMMIKKNKAMNNEGGFSFSGSEEKTIVENQANYNTGSGFSMDSTESNGVFEKNTASANGSTGFFISGENNTAIQNKAINNMYDGFYVVGDNNLLRNNRAIGNLKNGIHINIGANDNDIINNTMLDSHCDKFDQGSGSTWTGNNYDTECPWP